MRILAPVMIGALWVQLVLAQATSRTLVSHSAPTSVAQRLQEHHIRLTKDELVAALRSSNPEVRALAAAALVSLGDSNAAETIREAISTETVPATRTELAYALALLGRVEGKAALRQQCAQEDIPAGLRIRAAFYLLELDDNSCVESILELVNTAGESNDKLEAISFLSGVNSDKAPSNFRQQVERDALTLLDDPTPAVRMAAADALVSVESAAGTQALQDHISKERNEVVRLQMRAALQRLQQRKDRKDAH